MTVSLVRRAGLSPGDLDQRGLTAAVAALLAPLRTRHRPVAYAHHHGSAAREATTGGVFASTA